MPWRNIQHEFVHQVEPEDSAIMVPPPSPSICGCPGRRGFQHGGTIHALIAHYEDLHPGLFQADDLAHGCSAGGVNQSAGGTGGHEIVLRLQVSHANTPTFTGFSSRPAAIRSERNARDLTVSLGSSLISVRRQ